MQKKMPNLYRNLERIKPKKPNKIAIRVKEPNGGKEFFSKSKMETTQETNTEIQETYLDLADMILVEC